MDTVSSAKSKVILIPFEGSLDVGRQAGFKEALVKNSPLESEKLVLDFGKVEFIDSACLGALVAVLRRLKKKGGDLRLACLPQEVISIFQITRLDKMFRIYDKVEDAVASYSP